MISPDQTFEGRRIQQRRTYFLWATPWEKLLTTALTLGLAAFICFGVRILIHNQGWNRLLATPFILLPLTVFTGARVSYRITKILAGLLAYTAAAIPFNPFMLMDLEAAHGSWLKVLASNIATLFCSLGLFNCLHQHANLRFDPPPWQPMSPRKKVATGVAIAILVISILLPALFFLAPGNSAFKSISIQRQLHPPSTTPAITPQNSPHL